MTPSDNDRKRHFTALAVVLAVWTCVGCSQWQLPGFALGKTPGSPYVPVGQGVTLAGQESLEVYQKVRQAKRENALVLEVIGDGEPVRVLPLPPGQTSVFVSQLLDQTGIQDRWGSIDATLFRASSDTVTGIPMQVRMDEAGELVRPESDYALRAGDRLQVREKKIDAITTLMSTLGL